MEFVWIRRTQRRRSFFSSILSIQCVHSRAVLRRVYTLCLCCLHSALRPMWRTLSLSLSLSASFFLTLTGVAAVRICTRELSSSRLFELKGHTEHRVTVLNCSSGCRYCCSFFLVAFVLWSLEFSLHLSLPLSHYPIFSLSLCWFHWNIRITQDIKSHWMSTWRSYLQAYYLWPLWLHKLNEYPITQLDQKHAKLVGKVSFTCRLRYFSLLLCPFAICTLTNWPTWWLC